MREVRPDKLDACLNLGTGDIVRLVLCLLVEEKFKERLKLFRQDFYPDEMAGSDGPGIGAFSANGRLTGGSAPPGLDEPGAALLAPRQVRRDDGEDDGLGERSPGRA